MIMTTSSDLLQSIDRLDHLVTNRLIEVKAIHSLVMSDPDNYCKSSKLGIIQGDLDFLNMLLVDIRIAEVLNDD
jgi:hypothetical protein